MGLNKYETMVLKSTKLTGNRDSKETMQVYEIASACMQTCADNLQGVPQEIKHFFKIKKKRMLVKMQGKFLKSQAHVCKRVLTICKVGLGF